VTPLVSNTSSLFLSNLVRILSPISSDLYIIAGNANPKGHGKAYVYSVRHKMGINAFTRVRNYVYLQVRISYRLAKLARNIDLWIFFLGGEALLLPMLAAKLLGKKVVLALGGFIEKEGQIKKDMLYKPLSSLKRVNLALSNRIILYSPGLIEEWNLKKYRNKISIAHEHFLDFNKFRLEKPLTHRNNLIGYIGRLSQEKGILNFMEAIPEVLEERGNTSFFVGGDGQLHDKVKQGLERENLNKVQFVGWIPHDELPRYLSDLKLLVLPSYTEGLPNIMLEAMACGTPVLATPVGAIPDVIRDCETGFIMEDNSPECIARNIIRVLNHPNLEQIAQNVRALVEREFTFEKAVERYREILRDPSNERKRD